MRILRFHHLTVRDLQYETISWAIYRQEISCPRAFTQFWKGILEWANSEETETLVSLQSLFCFVLAVESFHFQVRFQTSANVNLRKRLVGWITLARGEVADFSLMDLYWRVEIKIHPMKDVMVCACNLFHWIKLMYLRCNFYHYVQFPAVMNASCIMYYTDLVTYVNLPVDLFHTTLFWARTLCCHRHCFGLLTCLSYIVLEFIFVVDILPTYIRLFIFSLRHVCVLPRTERFVCSVWSVGDLFSLFES